MNTVTVKINGVEYNLKGKEDNNYLLEVAAYVDYKYREISANNNKLGPCAVAVLSALNIADEYFKLGTDFTELNKKKVSLEERHNALKERLKEIKWETDESFKSRADEIESLKASIVENEKKIQQLDSYIEKVALLEKETKTKDKVNTDLESKIAALEKTLKNAEEKNKMLSNRNSQLESLIKQKDEDAKKVNPAEIIEKEAELSSLREQIEIMESELKGTISEKETLKSRNKEMRFQLQNSKYKVLDLEKKLIDAQFDLAIERKSKNPLLK